jgi:hypothetical protein
MSEFLMSKKEHDRLNILKQVQEKVITQIKAAELLGITDRQIRNLLTLLKVNGDKGLISKKRNRPSNHKYKVSTKEEVLKILRNQYEDFGPTLATEKLSEIHQKQFSRETIRKWMIEQYLWIPKVRKKKVHPLRRRKEYFGEMLQGDGSHHDWFENGDPCALVYFIDDATGIITSARFSQEETLDCYIKILRKQLEDYGIPWSIYTDKFSVFETSRKKENLTQFRRILNSLDIRWIGANSPQAKGRIERCNRTLQDRLVKELRIKGIKTIEEGNKFLEEYIPKYNQIFSKKAMKENNLHRILDGRLDLSRTLARYEERTTRNDLTFQFHNIHYRILDNQISGKKIEVRTDGEGSIRVFQESTELSFKKLEEIFEEQKIQLMWKEKNTFRPSQHHPWKVSGYEHMQREKKLKSL